MPSTKAPGMIRIKLAALLLEKGIAVDPEDLWTQQGFYKNNRHDLARWGSGEAKWKNGVDPDGNKYHHTIHLSSWDTMTECVRLGINIGKDATFGWQHVDINVCSSRYRYR